MILIALSLIGCLAVSSATNRTPEYNMTCPTVDVPDVVTACVVTSHVTLLPVETVIVITGVTGVETGIVVIVVRTSDIERRIDRVERYGSNKSKQYSNKKNNRKRLHKRPGWHNKTT